MNIQVMDVPNLYIGKDSPVQKIERLEGEMNQLKATIESMKTAIETAMVRAHCVGRGRGCARTPAHPVC